MGFIKAGFTGGFLGIVASVVDIFVDSPILEKFTQLGVLLASSFGKVCINTAEAQCSLAENFTTILATIVGNTIAYFLVFALFSLGISVIVMWLKPSKKVETQVVVQQQVPVQPDQKQQEQKTIKDEQKEEGEESQDSVTDEGEEKEAKPEEPAKAIVVDSPSKSQEESEESNEKEENEEKEPESDEKEVVESKPRPKKKQVKKIIKKQKRPQKKAKVRKK